MPVVFNEPLSFLQRLSEDMEYCTLLDKARCAYLSLYSLSMYIISVCACVGYVSVSTIESGNFEGALLSVSVVVYVQVPLNICRSIPQTYTHPCTYIHICIHTRYFYSHCDSSLEALQYVAAFAVTTYSSTAQRVSKPFNPLLGETFDLILGDMRAVLEQVCYMLVI